MAKKYEFDYDLIVIGSGAGGSVAATIAAADGKSVAIVECDAFGGESPNYSDVPMNALLHSANLFDEAKHGDRFGLRSMTLGYSYPLIRAWKDLAVKRTGAGGNRKYYESLGIDTFVGTAHFMSPNEISVNRRHISAGKFLIATGSHWVLPDITGIETVNYSTPRTILESIRPPKTLMIVGGGDSGVEIAQLMAIFGTKVYIAESADRLLPRRDAEVGQLIERILTESKGVTVMTQSTVMAVARDGLCKKVTVRRGGVEKTVRVDEIMVTAGRAPTTDLGLENAGVAYTARGITVNEFLQTSVAHIYAAGDVIGYDSHTHTALLESQVAANNMFRRNKVNPDYSAIPEVIFMHPGVASVGISEANCVKSKVAFKTAIAPLNIIARSNTSDFRDGFVKIIVGNRGIIIGGSVVAPAAGEIIQSLVIAIRQQMTASDLAATPHAFLSWSEAVRVAAAKLS